MFRLKLVPDNSAFDFLRQLKVTASISVLLVLASIGLFFINGLNLGIDFRGGILLEARSEAPVDIADVRADLSRLREGYFDTELGSEHVYPYSARRGMKSTNAAIHAIMKLWEMRLISAGLNLSARQSGQSWLKKGCGGYCALLAIMIYIWFRFEWQSIAAIIALSHDVLSTVGLFALVRFEFNLATVAAILTIAGYSINDTVVVFDRVRENLRK